MQASLITRSTLAYTFIMAVTVMYTQRVADRSERSAAPSRSTACYLVCRWPQTGTPFASRSAGTALPLFTVAAMIAGLPAKVTLDPVTSIRSFGANYTPRLSMYQAGPRRTATVPVKVLTTKPVP